MVRARPPVVVAVALAATVVATGCIASSETGSSEQATVELEAVPKTVPPQIGDGDSEQEPAVVGEIEDAPVGSGEARTVEPVDGLQGLHPVGWDEASYRAGTDEVEIVWFSGVEPCSVFSHVEIAYGDEAVVLTVIEGSDGDAATMSCIALAEQRRTVVTLDEPLGQRRIVDGAD